MTATVYEIAYGSPQLPLRLGHTAIGCAILKNGAQVLVKSDLHKALGHEGKSEDWLFDLLGSINKFFPVSGAIFNALENPIRYETERPDGTAVEFKGIPAELLPEICTTLVAAKNNGYMNVNQLKFAKSAEYLLKNMPQAGLIHAINEATGFVFYKTRAKATLQQFFENKANEAAFQWVKTLPDDFFEAVFAGNGLDWQDLVEDPRRMAESLNDIIYSRFSQPLLTELRANKPKRAYKNKFGIENDTQYPGLKAFVTEIMSLIQSSGHNSAIFMQLLNRAYPKIHQLIDPNALLPEQSFGEPPSELENMLKKALEFRKVYVTKK